MRQDQRQRTWSVSTNVKEVDFVIIYWRQKLRIPVQTFLRSAPIVLGGPVSAKLFHVIPIRAIAPVMSIEAVRPFGIPHSRENAVDRRLWNVDVKRARHLIGGPTGLVRVRVMMPFQGRFAGPFAGRCQASFPRRRNPFLPAKPRGSSRGDFLDVDTSFEQRPRQTGSSFPPTSLRHSTRFGWGRD